MLLLKIILSERLSSDKGISTRLTPLSEDNHSLCKKIAERQVQHLTFGYKRSSSIVFDYGISQTSLFFFGPSDRSRTCGLLNPIQARYQSALHPEITILFYHININNASINKFQINGYNSRKNMQNKQIQPFFSPLEIIHPAFYQAAALFQNDGSPQCCTATRGSIICIFLISELPCIYHYQ